MFPMLGKIRNKTNIDYEFETFGVADCSAVFKIREEHLPKKVWDLFFNLAKRRYKIKNDIAYVVKPGVKTEVPSRYFGLCKTSLRSFIRSMKSNVGADGISIGRLDVSEVFFHKPEGSDWELVVKLEGVYNKK